MTARPDYTGSVRTSRYLRPIAVAALVAAFLARPDCSDQTFRGGIDLVVVQATVVDRDGRLVPGLGRDDFHVFEDGVEQRIVQFTGDRLPVSLGLAVDVSDSMFGLRIAEARRVIDRFVIDLLDDGDEAFLMVFNHAAQFRSDWTRPRALAGRLDAVTPSGGTALYDAVIKAAFMFDKRRNQRCGLVVISDGADTASDASLQDGLRRLNQTDAFVYGIAIDAVAGPAINRGFAPEALTEISSQSGGYTEVIRDSSALGAAAGRIANELNHQYTLAYAPGRAADGQYHSIRVRTGNPEFVVRARRGYTHLRTRVR